jgi:hypothetical protein
MVVATSYKTDIQVNIDNVATDINEIKNIIEKTERVDLLFDITTPSKDWGYSAGIPSDTSITGKDFSKYKRLVGVFGEAGNAQWEVQVDLTLPTNYNSDLYVGYNSFSVTDSAFSSQMLSKLGSLEVKNNKTTLKVHSGYSYNGNSTFTVYYWLMSLRGYY